MNGASQRLILQNTDRSDNQSNLFFPLRKLSHIPRTSITVAIETGKEAAILFSTFLLLQTRFDININPILKEGGWGRAEKVLLDLNH